MIPICCLKYPKTQGSIAQTPLWGYIDDRGHIVVEPKFKTACFFSSHLAYVRDQQDKVGFIDKQGEWSIKPQFFDSLGFWGPWASVAHLNKSTQKLKWGVIDSTGKVVIDFLFDFIGPFMDGLARAQVNGKWGYINPQGKWVITPSFDWAGDIIEGIARVQTISSTLHTGYIKVEENTNKPWPLIVEDQTYLSQGEDYSEGMAAVKQGDLWGYINQEGQWVLHPQFIEAGECIENRISVMTQEGWRLGDRFGIFYSKPYQQLEPLSCGLSRFLRDQKWGFINSNGDEVISERFEEISDFCQGYALGIHRGQFIVINTKGELLWTDEAF